MIKQCEVCKKEITVSPYKIKRGWGRFCSIKCLGLTQRGPHAPNWKGGRSLRQGYIYIRVDGKAVREHRYIMEQHLGRKLLDDEIVHHINGDKENNNLLNLQLMTNSNHVSLHRRNPEAWCTFCCSVCNKQFTRLLTQACRNNTPCCSKSCANRLRRDKNKSKNFVCSVCGKSFKKYLSQLKNNSPCCSTKCVKIKLHKSTHTVYLCPICGRNFKRKRTTVHTKTPCCSKSCANKYR